MLWWCLLVVMTNRSACRFIVPLDRTEVPAAAARPSPHTINRNSNTPLTLDAGCDPCLRRVVVAVQRAHGRAVDASQDGPDVVHCTDTHCG